MSEHVIHEIISRGDWLRWRRPNVNASSVGALFGAHPFVTLDQLIADMAGQSIKGETASMRAGTLLEAVFPAALAEVHPEWKITKANTYHLRPELRLGCTPDFWIDDDGIAECKTFAEREWERCQGRPHLAYSLQALTQLIVTGRKWAVLAVIVRSSSLPLFLFDVPRHPAAEAKILAAVADFWAKHDAGEFPVVTPVDEIEALLDDGSHLDLSTDNFLPGALQEREKLVAERGSYERRIKYIDGEIKGRLGAASTGWLPGWAISWRAQHRREHVVPASDFRVLRVKRTEDDGDG
jgi:predicted phage-related endonuclease